MKRILVFALWTNLRSIENANENKLRYELRQFFKTAKEIIKEDFDINVHILVGDYLERATGPIKKILSIAKRQKLLNLFKTMTMEYGGDIIDLEKFVTTRKINDDIFIRKTDKKLVRFSHDDKNITYEKFAKMSSVTCKNASKTGKIMEFLNFDEGYHADIIDKNSTRVDAIKYIEDLYLSRGKLITNEVFISDYSNLTLPLTDKDENNMVFVCKKKSYGISILSHNKDIPKCFSQDGHRLTSLLKALDQALNM